MKELREILALYIRVSTSMQFRSDQFIIEDWCKKSLTAGLTREHIAFYKILHISAGRGVLIAGMRKYLLSNGDVVFIRPDEIMGWKTISDTIEGHFCFIHPRFFRHARHVLEMLRTFPHLHPPRSLVTLSKIESAMVQQSFQLMLNEASGDF